jgi:protein-disulfide isomerase
MPTTDTEPTRKQRRDEAHRKRAEQERRAAAGAARRRRLTRLGALLGATAAVVAILIAVSGSGSAPKTTAAAPITGAPESRALLAGIPQDGITLGHRNAPVRVVEFADLQCPFCAQASKDVLPGVIRDQVRTGKVRLEFRPLAFIGDDSVRAARFAMAAAAQNRLWNVVDLLYANQGDENSGWATDALLRRAGAAVPGLDVSRVLAERDGAAVTAQLEAASELAERHDVTETPTFLVGRGTDLEAVDAAGLPAAIEAALGS